MVKYSCETCQKIFTQKGHYDSHNNRKSPCKKDNTIEALIEKKVQEVLSKTNEGVIKNDATISTSTITTTTILQSTHIDYSTKTRDELIAFCKEMKIKGYSGKKKGDIAKLISDSQPKNELIIPATIEPVVDKSNIKRIVSLFSGCGGLDFGFHKNSKYKHVFVNDFDSNACDSYEKNFNIKPVCRDIKQIETIPDCDLLIGGFPCQGFSMANPYRNEKDTRNELYLEILRLLRLKQPSYFLLENVKGLLNMGGYETSEDKKNQKGKIMKIILKDLTECGYKVIFKLFDIKQYDVPQKRQRVIIIGVKNTIPFEPIWPKSSEKILTLKDAIGDLPIEYNSDIQHIGTKHKCAVTGYLGNRELKWEEPSPTITGRGGGSGGPVIHNHPSLKRRLTVRECARIQTFPDSFVFSGSISSMYKQLGNAVPCKFSEYLSTIFENAP
jgi:DNA (cytosine-5)-methyltransferase 1